MLNRLEELIGKNIYMIGIGGSSMSGLALMLKKLGCNVSGSDKTASHKTAHLQEEGINVFIGHDGKNIEGADYIIYSAAISSENPERKAAFQNGIPQIERCDLIGMLMKHFKSSYAVAGTHGKTTTTAMLAQTFLKCGEDPAIHIGGELPFLGGSSRIGDNNDSFICEACEFNKSFLHFFPTTAIILNIDEDHLDCYKDIDDIENAFLDFAHLVPKDGLVIGCGDDKRVRNVLSKLSCRTMLYGLEPFNELRAEDISYDELGKAHFTATLFGHPLTEVWLSVPGEHNIKDALAVIAAANDAQLPMGLVSDALGDFTGVKRRYELTSITDGVALYQDYGHNPTEIKNVLSVARVQAKGKLWSVFQPHTYSRTKALFEGFLTCFDDADTVLVTDICGAREVDPGDINSRMVVDALIKHGINAHLTPSFDDAEAYLRANWAKGDSVVTHGCGDIYLLNEQIALHGDSVRRT